MKQKILTYFILVTACIGLHSCLFHQDDYFDSQIKMFRLWLDRCSL